MEYYIVRNENGINIVVVGVARLFDLGVREDGIVNDSINIGSCLIFSGFLTMTNHLPNFVVRYVDSRSMTDDMLSSRSFSLELVVSIVILKKAEPRNDFVE